MPIYIDCTIDFLIKEANKLIVSGIVYVYSRCERLKALVNGASSEGFPTQSRAHLMPGVDRFGPKVGQIDPKWGQIKSGAFFHVRFKYILIR